MDAGATGLRGNNAENSGVLRMKSAMERCGRGDRIGRRERRKHRKTRSHRPRSEIAAATGTENRNLAARSAFESAAANRGEKVINAEPNREVTSTAAAISGNT